MRNPLKAVQVAANPVGLLLSDTKVEPLGQGEGANVGAPDTVSRVCAFSTAAPSHTLLLKFLAARKAYCRAQLKPAVYCASICIGKASVRLSRPLRVSITKLHIWPPVIVQPLAKLAPPQAWR